MGFNLEDYEPVASRLARWLEQTEGHGRVITHLVHYSDNRCVFRAELYVGDTLVATGWEEETRGDGVVNKTSHLANCETGSLGRALANAGLSGSDPTKRPSREEMAKVARAGGPVLPTGSDTGGRYATPKQMAFVRRLAADRGLTTEEDIQAAVDEALGGEVLLSQLAPAQASRIIDVWRVGQ